MARTTIDIPVPHDAAERARIENESLIFVRQRINEVLRKYNVRMDEAPLDALALAMKRLIDA